METKNIYAYNPEETVQASVFSKLMRNVYRWMTFALAITGLTAACVAGNATLMQFILGNQAVFLGLIIAELVVAFTLIGRVSKLSFTNASLLFILYSILTGVTLSTIFLVYEIGSIASTFFVTAGTFGTMSRNYGVSAWRMKTRLLPAVRPLLMMRKTMLSLPDFPTAKLSF
mgnify:CR=1 FL=1